MANTFTALTGTGAGSSYQAGDKFGFQTAEKIRGNFNALAEAGIWMPMQAGVIAVTTVAATFQDVPFYIDRDINADEVGGFTVDITYYSYTTNASTSVTLRLRNTTDSSTIDTSDAVTATTITKETNTVTLTAGAIKNYRLQIAASSASHPVVGWAELRIRKT
jgi:hypothetical protein